MASTTKPIDLTIENFGIYEHIACQHCDWKKSSGFGAAAARNWGKAHLNHFHGLRHGLVIQRVA